MKWFNAYKKPINDFKKQLLDSLYTNKFQKKIIIGCDSQIVDNGVTFITTIVILYIGHGGVFFYNKDRVQFCSKYLSIENRLFQETYRSVEIAKMVDNLLEDTQYCVEQIHCDLNSNNKYKSNKAVSMCVGYICGNNYKPIIKPDSFAASTIADSLTR